MLERLSFGELPAKHHIALRDASGALRYEHCLTRAGFDGPYSIAYHVHRPQALRAVQRAQPGLQLPAADVAPGLRRRHFRGARLPQSGRVALLSNADVTISLLKPERSEAAYFVNADADELFFVRKGGGLVRSVLGDLTFGQHDYVGIPKGVLYRMQLDDPDAELLLIECHGGIGVPAQFRNPVGQLRMDAPYCHRDFRHPEFRGPLDEQIRRVVVQRGAALHEFQAPHSPLDVVGWDGTLYPWAFPILAFQPRVSSVHLPPIWHGTFAARGALICSFVPRPLDFHPEAVPCPYPHSSSDVDELIYYVSGAFSSRTGVEAGSLTLHPRGIPHGPQPGRYEASLGVKSTDEIAVMLDCYLPLTATGAAAGIEDQAYDEGFTG
ncbi:MAG TPA: homogentisate 1,2-dioxygenase, partial [Polyangiales bacterium]|nr:homogentisate 1,2-dioxygenase [Polyangiales bacterium]